MFLGQAGMFLSFQARRSSATRSSTSDLTVDGVPRLEGPAVRQSNLGKNQPGHVRELAVIVCHAT